jgi:hypothetical protein
MLVRSVQSRRAASMATPYAASNAGRTLEHSDCSLSDMPGPCLSNWVFLGLLDDPIGCDKRNKVLLGGA